MAKWLNWLEMVNTMPATFQGLSTALKDLYFVEDYANIACDKLCTVRQKGSVADYCAEFDTIVLSLSESHPEDLIHAFIYALKPSL